MSALHAVYLAGALGACAVVAVVVHAVRTMRAASVEGY